MKTKIITDSISDIDLDIVICRAGHYTNSSDGRNGISVAYELLK